MNDFLKNYTKVIAGVSYGILFGAVYGINWFYYYTLPWVGCDCPENRIHSAIMSIGVPVASILSVVIAYFLKKRFSLVVSCVISFFLSSILLYCLPYWVYHASFIYTLFL